MKILNLYAGLGGNRKFWKNCDVTAIEIDNKIAAVYKQLYPGDNVIITDAHQYLLEHYSDYDFIWSSRPCQTHTRMAKSTLKKKRYIDVGLYEEIIFLTHFFKGKWCVENVKPYYKPLIEPSVILGRHFFWSNFDIPIIKTPHIKGFINTDNTNSSEELKKWLGIEYQGNLYYEKNHNPGQVLRNCVHPDVGKHIFNCISI